MRTTRATMGSARPEQRLWVWRCAAWAGMAALGAALAPLCAAQESSRADAALQAAARATLERVAKGLDGVRELRAEYTQEQHSLLLDEALVSSGYLHLRAEPGCIVLEVEKPRSALIRSDSKSHLVYHPTTKRAERFLFESNELTKALLACFTADLARIEGLFSITAYSEDLASKRATLSLQPERDEVRAAVRSLTLEIDLASGLPTRIIQVNSEGEELRLSLRNTVRNPERRPGDTAIFDRPLPKDVVVSERSVPSTGSHER